MKIAVPYENGEICSHLAQVKEFLIFDVVDDEIISTKTVKQTYAEKRKYCRPPLRRPSDPDDDRPARNQHPGSRRRQRRS